MSGSIFFPQTPSDDPHQPIALAQKAKWFEVAHCPKFPASQDRGFVGRGTRQDGDVKQFLNLSLEPDPTNDSAGTDIEDQHRALRSFVSACEFLVQSQALEYGIKINIEEANMVYTRLAEAVLTMA